MFFKMTTLASLTLWSVILGQLVSAGRGGLEDGEAEFMKREKQGKPLAFNQVNFKHISCLGSVCYIIVEKPETWPTASAVCQRYGGYLAEVKTAQQQDQLVKLKNSILAGHIWIGGHDLGNEGHFTWQHSNDAISLPGKPGFQKWDAGQPDDWNQVGGEHCMAINHHSRWDDDQCELKYPFACQKDQ